MDVHRSRFVPFPTSAITALAFSRSSDSKYEFTPPALRLALGRANGAIEIWNPLNGSWVQEASLVGEERSIDGLVWTQDPDERDSDGGPTIGRLRLFSIASSPAVTEWDLATGLPKRRSTGNFSEVWCFAAQPRWKRQKNAVGEPQASDLLVGCGDGTMALLSTADNDLQFKRFLARVSGKKARCMCVTYKNRDVAVAGFADSIIRIYDTKTGAALRNMSLGVGIPGAPKDALVWQVKCLPNGDIVSADSNGEVRFWDGRTHSLLQRIAGHNADCLDLAVSYDGQTVFSGSIDGRMAVYRLSNNAAGRRMWSKVTHRRVHHGEVKSLAAFDSKEMSVVVSGGSDVVPIVTPLREYGREPLRSLPALPQVPPVVSASKARLLVSWHERDVMVWRIAKQTRSDAAESISPRKLVAKILLNTEHPIRDLAISEDGRLIVAATNSETKAFQLRKRSQLDQLVVRKLELPESISSLGARIVRISTDAKWLAVVTPDSEVHVLRVSNESSNPKALRFIKRSVELERRNRKPSHQTGLGAYDISISHMAFSSDSAVLATCDMSGFIDSWVLEGHEDMTAPDCEVAAHSSTKESSVAASDSDSDSSDDDDDESTIIFHGQHWADNPAGQLPKLDAAPLVLNFRPSKAQPSGRTSNGNPGVHATRNNPHAHSHDLPLGPHMLFVVTVKHNVYEFDVHAGKLSDWSRRNPSDVLPREFCKLRDRTIGAIWDVNSKHERLWLYGYSWVFMLDVRQEFGDGTVVVKGKNKRRRSHGNDTRPTSQKRLKAIGEDRSQSHDAIDETPIESESQLIKTHNEQTSAKEEDEEPQAQCKFWHTIKYKPILGMVQISDFTEASDQDSFEVVLVERPIDENGR